MCYTIREAWPSGGQRANLNQQKQCNGEGASEWIQNAFPSELTAGGCEAETVPRIAA
jgi:hypothetical protein